MSKEFEISQQYIENRIFTIRGEQVMLDSDLALIYQTETKYVNRAVKRNIDRFPENFVFQLTEKEWDNLRFQTGTSKNDDLEFQTGTSKSHGGRRTLPYVFTEQGVAMLSAVLKTDIAIKVSIQIMNAFVEMRKLINNNSKLLQRIKGVELKQIQTEENFKKIFNALENKELVPNQGIFFDGQVFDAYVLASKIVRSARESIVLIDNYMDETTFVHLAKKNRNVKAILLCKKINSKLKLDLKKANQQYGKFELKMFANSHDRFLIIDKKEVYHLGASLKDLGKKWFAFSKMNPKTVEQLLQEVERITKE